MIESQLVKEKKIGFKQLEPDLFSLDNCICGNKAEEDSQFCKSCNDNFKKEKGKKECV